MQGQRRRNRIDKPYIREIDFIFYNEKEIRQAVENEQSSNTMAVEIKDKKGKQHEIKYPESWLIVIDRTYAWCKRQKGCHYEAAQRHYNGESYKTICTGLYISTTSLSYLLDSVRIYAALQAAQLHLIKVE